MSIVLANNVQKIKGKMSVPGDKSISHRSIMFGAIAKGKTYVYNLLKSDDVYRTIDCFQKLGVNIYEKNGRIVIDSDGFSSFREPTDILYTGNSGTTSRLLLGILAGTDFYSVVSGDQSLNRRPFKRVTKPLEMMGGKFIGRNDNNFLPLSVIGNRLSGIEYELPIASAQVKSALIFAGLHASGTTTIIEPIATRNHTEKMLMNFGGKLIRTENKIIIQGNQSLIASECFVPGDFSSAAFFIALALLVPNSELIIENVSLNPTRTGLLDIIQKMNGFFEILDQRLAGGEEIGTIRVCSSQLVGTTISGDLVPRTIDEIPIIALLATQAEGITVIKNAEELKVKESNRIDSVATELQKLGADIEPTEDGMIIRGKTKLTGGQVNSHDDHRIGMMLSIASCIASGNVQINHPQCVSISYPNFYEDLRRVIEN